MAELRRVAGPSSPLGGRDGRLIAIVVAAILVAIIKPWGSDARPGPTPGPGSSAAPTSIATASARPSEPFDFGIFEGFEPNPAWEIWPAGREFSLGFAMRINGDEPMASASLPQASGHGGPSASTAPPTPSPSATPDVPPGPPTWSSGIAISPGSKLTVVAINMPLGYSIPEAQLTRIGPIDGGSDVPLIRLPSPWPDHFIVLGIDDGSGRALAAWPAGHYRLDLRIAPGGWSRTIRIEVTGAAPAGSATPAGSAAPAADPSPSGAPAASPHPAG